MRYVKDREGGGAENAEDIYKTGRERGTRECRRYIEDSGRERGRESRRYIEDSGRERGRECRRYIEDSGREGAENAGDI